MPRSSHLPSGHRHEHRDRRAQAATGRASAGAPWPGDARFWQVPRSRWGFPLASPASSAATASSASTPNSWRISAGTTRARAVRAAAFRRCCRRSGRFDGAQGNYYVRDQ